MKLSKNFNLSEFESKDGSETPPEVVENLKELSQNLQILRDYIGGVSIQINSGYRSPEHNREVGGAKNSQHLYGKAGDIVVKPFTPKDIKTIIEELISNGKIKEGGLSAYNTFVHYDIRGTKARW